MTDAQSRVTITFVGADAGLTATAGAINTQLGSIAASAATLAGRLGELTQASQTYAAGLKSSTGSTSELEKANDRLAKQEITLLFRQQAKEAQALASAQKQAEAEAQKLAAAQQRLAQSQAKEQLKAEAEVLKALAQAEREAEREAERLFQTNARLSQQNAAEQLEKQRQGYQTLALASGATAATIGGLFTTGIESYTKFSGSITQLGVVTQTTGTEKIGALRAEIERLAAATSKTPSEVAALSVSLARAGFTADKIKDSLAGIVQGAEATNTVPETFGKVVGAIIESYQLQASESGKVSDAIVAGANVAGLKVDELGEAFKRAGPTAAGANQSYKETIATLGVLRAANLEGSVAGSGYVAILNRLKIASAAVDSQFAGLVKGNKQMVAAFKELQVESRNADGSLKPLSEIVPQIQAKLNQFSKSDSDLLRKSLFGEQGSAAFNALTAVSKERIDQIKTAVDNSAGSAASASKTLTSDLTGSLNILRGSTELATNKFGEFAAVGLLPVVQGATSLINTFLSLPGPVQNALIGVTAFTGILAAAVAAVIAFELARTNEAIVAGVETAATTLNTIATNANAAAKILAAAATGTLTEAQEASISSFVKGAATAGLFAGAVAAIGLAVDTFQKVNAAANETRAGLDDFEKSLTKLTEAELKSNDAATQKKAAADLETQANKRIQDSIGGVQQALDYLRKIGDTFSFRHLLEEFAKLDAVPQPIKDLVNGIVNFLPKISTAAEASANNATVAFGEVLDSADKVQSQFQTLFKGGFENATKEEIEALNGAIAASISAIEKAKPANEADAKAKELRLKQLKEEQAELAKLGKAEADNALEKPIGSGNAKADPKVTKKAEKEQEKELKAEREKQAQEEADKLRDARSTAKAKEEEAFREQERAKTDAFERQQKAAKEVFAEQERLKTKQFEKELQTESEAFQKQLNLEKKAFEKELQDDEKAFRKNEDAEKKAAEKGFNAEQKGIDRELQLEFAKNPRERRNLQKQFDQQDRESARRDQLEAPLKAKRDAFGEAQTQKQETFRKAQDAKKETFDEAQSRKQDTFRNTQDAKKDGFNKKIKQEEEAFDSQQSGDKRSFESKSRQEEAAFKQDQRDLDRRNAQEIKRIIESIKSPIPSPSPTPEPVTPRFTGGPVAPGQTYLGGERGVERIDFGGGRDALVGSHGPQLFQVDRPGYVHPHHSPFTQAVVQTAHYQHQSVGRSPSVQVTPATVVYSDDALLREMRQLRSEVSSMRPIQQAFDITTQNPMTEVYAAMKQAARLKR